MSERDRQNPNDRSPQQGGGRSGSESYDSPRQANQWQSGDGRQAGGDWQQDAGRGNDDPYRFATRGGAAQDDSSFGRSHADRGGYQQAYRNDQDRGQNRDYRSQTESQSGRQDPYAGYGGRTFDASGGNSFASFTSEDYGGRDFSNRGGTGGASGGLRSSESYRPSYGVSRLFGGDHEDRSRGSREYGEWRQYGESRGFLERAGDEVASWFGSEDAARRREQDRRDDHRGGSRNDQYGQTENHRGRGPANYTRSDERIREDANDHLTHDWGVDASHITVSVKNGELTLDGTVDSRQAKRRAEDAVEHISGVKHVQNNLRVQERNSSTNSTSYSSGSGLTGSSQAYSSSTSSPGQTGASTTGGTGSSAPAGAASASAPRPSDKTS